MKKLAILIMIVSCVGFAHAAGKIVKPWRATTAIVKAGQSFEVWFDADSGQTVNSVDLEAEYHTVSASKSITTGDWEYDEMSGNRYNTRITVIPFRQMLPPTATTLC